MIQQVAEAFVEALRARNIHTLQELAACYRWELVGEVVDGKEQPKLATRLYSGLLGLMDANEELFKAISAHTATYDEAKLRDLERECGAMAPAMKRVRCNAVDAGLY